MGLLQHPIWLQLVLAPLGQHFLLEFLVDNIFVVFVGKVFQQIVGIPMGTNCAPLLDDIFLYSYEAEFIQSLLSTGRKHLASRFNFTAGTSMMFCL